ncbi:MAG: YdjY domain-containing protein [Planctomycetes bacterium]|nr:YdjY domain-containing protein [Planctomycetota bacterium]
MRFAPAAAALAAAALAASCASPGAPSGALPPADRISVDAAAGEVVVPAVVQHPEGKPCIDDWGQRVQAFAGCRLAAGGEAKFRDWFVFLSPFSTEEVHDALLSVGAAPRVHITMADGKKLPGLVPETKPEHYLQGDSVVISILWEEGGARRELPYEDFAQEKILVDGAEVVKPWTPHFVFHGSGAIHASATGCIACPCDCAGGIIADNRYPIYNPKPVVRFDWTKAPPVGTPVWIRLRATATR